jgi:hypothetical protein
MTQAAQFTLTRAARDATRGIRTRGLGLRLDASTIITFCGVFALVMFLGAILDDSDTYWQIRTGEWILDHFAIPTTDPFSFTAGTRQWFAHEWLAETLMALAYRASGIAGVMMLAAAATGLTAAIVMHHARRFLPGIYAVLTVVVALANAAPSMLARPHLLAWPCLALWCGGLISARARRAPPSFWLLPVMLLWVNLHGSFMIGLLLPAAFMVEALFDPGINIRQVLAAWASFIAAAWAIALINPDGVDGLLFPFHLLGMKNLTWIGEWQPTDFSWTQPLELIILGGLALGLTGKIRLPPLRLLMLLALIHGALSHARNEQLLGIVGVLVLVEPLGLCLGRGEAKPLSGLWRNAATGAVLLATVALVVRIVVPPGPERTGASFAAVLDNVPPSLRAKPVLNDYSLGGALIFQGVRPFIDSRADLYGDAFLSRYRQIVAPERDALESALRQYGIVWTIFPVSSRTSLLLDQEPGWHRVVVADGLVIYARAEESPR